MNSRRGDEALQEADAWRAIIAAASDAIITVDEGHRIILFNATAERMFRCPLAEALGETLDRFIPSGAREGHRDYIRAFGETGVSARPMGGERLLTAVRADGEEFPMEARISQATVTGRKFFTVIVREVTERKRAEEAQARLAAIVESSDDAVVGKTLDGIVTSWNKGAERIFGYTAEEMVGTPISRLVPPERPDEMPTILAAIRRGERVEHFETERLQKDGRRIHLSITVSPIIDSTGRIIGASKIGRDVTQRKHAEEERQRLLAAAEQARAEAEAASRAKDEFLSMVSHELRTPLSSMLGWIGVLRQGKLSPERAARALATMERSGRIQAELIEDLLDVSRIVTGRLRLSIHAVGLRVVLQAALDGIRPDAAAKGIRLDTFLDTDATVAGDEVRLQQVVGNVINNAVKFTPAGGHVEVHLERTDGEARIVVRDTGRGITRDFLPRVFEPFQQAEAVKSRKTGGLGLGLAIVRHLVEKHGGQVTAESAGVGQGSTFTITLPLLLRTLGRAEMGHPTRERDAGSTVARRPARTDHRR